MRIVRPATSIDLPRIVDIYNQAIATHLATADTVPFTKEMRKKWFDAHKPETYPIYTCENEDGMVVGYLSISSYRDRPALVRTAEVSYYVDYDWHGRGIGSMLMEYALVNSARIGKKVLLAIVLEWNQASVKLLEKFGFSRWGYLPQVAEFDGRLCGQYYYGKNLSGSVDL